MANWCDNIVGFEANEQTMEKLGIVFMATAGCEVETEHGQLPLMFQDNDGYMFDIRWEENVLYYQTKWCPNIELIRKVADEFGVGFVHSYEEMGNGIYGEALYLNGNLTEIDLDSGDFALYQYNQDSEDYTFEGETYESDYQILETLLERKKQAHLDATS